MIKPYFGRVNCLGKRKNYALALKIELKGVSSVADSGGDTVAASERPFFVRRFRHFLPP